MAKINLTKRHLSDLEMAVKELNLKAKETKSLKEKHRLRDLAVTVSDILVRHENRLEKEY